MGVPEGSKRRHQKKECFHWTILRSAKRCALLYAMANFICGLYYPCGRPCSDLTSFELTMNVFEFVIA